MKPIWQAISWNWCPIIQIMLTNLDLTLKFLLLQLKETHPNYMKSIKSASLIRSQLSNSPVNTMGEEPPKYQVEDVLNKKKPPPQILDLNGITWVIVFPLPQLSRIKIACCRVETEEEFRTTMEKIPDYRIREEDVRIFLISNLLLFPSSLSTPSIVACRYVLLYVAMGICFRKHQNAWQQCYRIKVYKNRNMWT